MSEKAAATGDITDPAKLTVDDISKLSLEQLRDLYLQVDDNVLGLKIVQAEILKEAAARVEGDLSDAFKATEKTHGSLTRTVGKVGFKYEVKMGVKWDTEKLKPVFELMPDRAAGIVKVEMSISEKTFDGLAAVLEKDSPALKQIMDARTVTFSPAKIVFDK